MSIPAELFAGCFSTGRIDPLPIVFLGVCDDTHSSFRKGSAQAPDAIRSRYHASCYNSSTESGLDLGGCITDLGNLIPSSDPEASREHYQREVRSLLSAEKIPVVAGGDHAITISLVAAFADHSPIHVVQIDAHPDLYPDYQRDPFSHACTAARMLEMNHVASLTCIGARTFNQVQRGFASGHANRYTAVPARECLGELSWPSHIGERERVYLTVDIDAFDPGFAPGVSHPVPGGLSPRQVLNFIQTAPCRLVGMDLVEVNPELDENGRTAILAARILHEGMGWAARGISS